MTSVTQATRLEEKYLQNPDAGIDKNSSSHVYIIPTNYA